MAGSLTTFGLAALFAAQGATPVPSDFPNPAPPPFLPPSSPQPVCMLLVEAVGGDEAGFANINYLDNGTLQVERPLASGESQQDFSDTLIKLDTVWYAQGRPHVERFTMTDADNISIERARLKLIINPGFDQALANAKSLELVVGDTKLAQFDIAAVRQTSLANWQTCIADATLVERAGFAPNRYSPQSPLHGLQPLNKNNWLNSNDYPSRLMSQEIQGTVAFTLEVSVNGLVRNCTLTPHNTSTIIPAQNNVTELNEQTCRTIKRRARFTPATNGEGRPFVSNFQGRARWVLPYDKPPRLHRK